MGMGDIVQVKLCFKRLNYHFSNSELCVMRPTRILLFCTCSIEHPPNLLKNAAFVRIFKNCTYLSYAGGSLVLLAGLTMPDWSAR